MWKNTIEIDIEICERIIFLIMKMPCDYDISKIN